MANSLAFPFWATPYYLISLRALVYAPCCSRVYHCISIGTTKHTYFRNISYTARLFLSLPGTEIWWLRARLIRLLERPFRLVSGYLVAMSIQVPMIHSLRLACL